MGGHEDQDQALPLDQDHPQDPPSAAADDVGAGDDESMRMHGLRRCVKRARLGVREMQALIDVGLDSMHDLRHTSVEELEPLLLRSRTRGLCTHPAVWLPDRCS